MHKINEFSVPMPFEVAHIEHLATINEQHKKSKITMLYNCLPMNAEDYSGFEQLRATDTRIKSLNDLIQLVNYAKSLGMEFTYLLNSVNTPNPNEFRENQDKFRAFLERLLEGNITKLRISNTMIADYVICNYPQFTIYSSTSQEYYSLKQYSNFFNYFSTIKGVVPSWDVNKNFEFLTNFQKRFPDVTMELMVNEGCLGGCPFRRDHHAEAMARADVIQKDRFSCFFPASCDNLYRRDRALYLCLNNIIYPWDIDTYNKYGIFNFKLVGRNSPDFLHSTRYIERFSAYLDGVESIENIYNSPIIDFNHYTIFNKALESIRVKDIIDFLPKLSFFEKNGEKCSYSCGATCKYCYECAEKINRHFIDKGENYA
ncbi:MAG: hypothetical protein NC485_14425 [Ruminococcus flavefaciens]|nr:hypothetical protein [Ruminococcus flavefaciens]